MRIIKFFLLLAVGYWLLVIANMPAFAQTQPKLQVDGDIDTPSLALTPQASPPGSPGEGMVYYDNPANDAYIYSDTPLAWNPLATPKNVATIIVAASNSLDDHKADPAYRCNGAGDGIGDQTEINAAITATAAVGGGAVYLLEGTYNITGSITINSDNISLIGAGAGTVLKYIATNFNMIFTSSVSHILISNLMINGNNIMHSSDVTAIFFSQVTYSKIDKVWIEDMRGSGYGIGCRNNSNYNTISNNHIQRTIEDGILLNSSSNNIIVDNVVRDTTGDGGVYNIVLNNGANNNLISNNYLYNSNQHSIYIGYDSSPTPPCNNNIISGNQVIYARNNGIYIKNGSNNVISSNNVQSNREDGIFVASPNNVVSDNMVRSSTDHGIVLTGGASGGNNIAFGNMCYEVGAGEYDGIHIRSSNNTVSSNRIYDSSGSQYGINVYNSSASNNYLVGNYIDGTGFTAKISDSGTGTKYTGKDKITLEPASITLTAATDIIDPSIGDSASNRKGGPSSHIILNNTSGGNLTVAIEDGKAAGDILILEGTDNTKTVTINDSGNVNLAGTLGYRELGQYDTLELIWNGTQWVEVSFTNNVP